MKAFGISALVLSVVAIFIPLAGWLLAGLAGFLAMLSAGRNLALGLSAVIINIVNILFLSPSLIIIGSSTTDESSNKMAGGLLSIQILAIIVFMVVGVRGYLRGRAQQVTNVKLK